MFDFASIFTPCELVLKVYHEHFKNSIANLSDVSSLILLREILHTLEIPCNAEDKFEEKEVYRVS